MPRENSVFPARCKGKEAEVRRLAGERRQHGPHGWEGLLGMGHTPLSKTLLS